MRATDTYYLISTPVKIVGLLLYTPSYSYFFNLKNLWLVHHFICLIVSVNSILFVMATYWRTTISNELEISFCDVECGVISCLLQNKIEFIETISIWLIVEFGDWMSVCLSFVRLNINWLRTKPYNLKHVISSLGYIMWPILSKQDSSVHKVKIEFLVLYTLLFIMVVKKSEKKITSTGIFCSVWSCTEASCFDRIGHIWQCIWNTQE